MDFRPAKKQKTSSHKRNHVLQRCGYIERLASQVYIFLFISNSQRRWISVFLNVFRDSQSRTLDVTTSEYKTRLSNDIKNIVPFSLGNDEAEKCTNTQKITLKNLSKTAKNRGASPNENTSEKCLLRKIPYCFFSILVLRECTRICALANRSSRRSPECCQKLFFFFLNLLQLAKEQYYYLRRYVHFVFS